MTKKIIIWLLIVLILIGSGFGIAYYLQKNQPLAEGFTPSTWTQNKISEASSYAPYVIVWGQATSWSFNGGSSRITWEKTNPNAFRIFGITSIESSIRSSIFTAPNGTAISDIAFSSSETSYKEILYRSSDDYKAMGSWVSYSELNSRCMNKRKYVQMEVTFKGGARWVYNPKFILTQTKVGARGKIVDETTRNPISGATVKINGYTGSTNINGDYEVSVPYINSNSTYSMTVSKSGYNSQSKTYTDTCGKALQAINFDLKKIVVPNPTCNNNGACDSGENTGNCPGDCPPPAQICNNNGSCDQGENNENCSGDCPLGGGENGGSENGGTGGGGSGSVSGGGGSGSTTAPKPTETKVTTPAKSPSEIIFKKITNPTAKTTSSKNSTIILVAAAIAAVWGVGAFLYIRMKKKKNQASGNVTPVRKSMFDMLKSDKPAVNTKISDEVLPRPAQQSEAPATQQPKVEPVQPMPPKPRDIPFGSPVAPSQNTPNFQENKPGLKPEFGSNQSQVTPIQSMPPAPPTQPPVATPPVEPPKETPKPSNIPLPNSSFSNIPKSAYDVQDMEID